MMSEFMFGENEEKVMEYSSSIVLFTINIAFFGQVSADITSLVGSTVELKCQYEASGSQPLVWYKVTPTTISYSSNDFIFLDSYPDIKNRVTITGDHSISQYHLKISDVRTTDAGDYTCTVGSNSERHRLVVIEGPSSVSIDNKSSDNKLYGTEDQSMTISCTAVGGTPAPDMVLQILDQNYTVKSGPQKIQHTITKVDRSYDGSTVTCLAGYQSISYFPKYDIANVYLYFKPSTPTLSPDPVVTEETRPLSVTCTSSGGRPNPTGKWSIDNADITDHASTSSTHDETADTYTVTSTLMYSVNRNDHRKIIMCGFNNAATGSSYVSVTRTLDIRYPPSVTVDNKTFNPSDNPRQITCHPNGNPAVYTFLKWQHKSKYGKDIREIDGNSTLTLPPVPMETRYQDTGEYVCTVSNGIKDQEENVYQQASGFVTSFASPVFLDGDYQSVLGQFRRDVTIQVLVYSEPRYTSKTWMKGSSTITPSLKYSMKDDPASLTDTFHGTEIQVDGYRMTLTIYNMDEYDFVNYTLSVGNGVEQTVHHLVNLVSASPPETPINFTLVSTTESSITLQWLPGFNGGHEQTFVVEYRAAGSSDWRKSEVPLNDKRTVGDDALTYTLMGLQDGTQYELRMYAQNKFNKSNSTESVTISTKANSEAGSVVGAVAGVVAGMVVILIVVVAVVLWKRRASNGVKTKKVERCEMDSESDDGLRDNILYKSVDTRSKPAETCEYAEVQKPNDVYAEVKKPETQTQVKKNKGKGKKTQGMKKQKLKAVNNNTAEEYANQSEYANAGNVTGGSGGYKNADGLQYADLSFTNPAKPKDGKLVIHGLDERTIYCDVDLTKKAPPLPQEGAYELTDISKGNS